MKSLAVLGAGAVRAALAIYPFLPIAESNRGEQFTILFIYGSSRSD